MRLELEREREKSLVDPKQDNNNKSIVWLSYRLSRRLGVAPKLGQCAWCL